MEILHLKVRKFATKVASRQNSVNYVPSKKSNHELCESHEYDMLVELRVKLHIRKIARWVKHYTMYMYKKEHSVKNYTQGTFFHVPCGKCLHNQRLWWFWQMWGLRFIAYQIGPHLIGRSHQKPKWGIKDLIQPRWHFETSVAQREKMILYSCMKMAYHHHSLTVMRTFWVKGFK